MAGNTAGTLVLQGGAIIDPFYSTIYKAAGKTSPRVAVLLSSNPSIKEVESSYHNHYQKKFADFGFLPEYLPLALDTYEEVAYDPKYIGIVRDCDVVFLGGGSQSRHARCLLNDDGTSNPMGLAVKHVFDNGGVIAGNSAGTHVISNPMYSGGLSYEALRANGMEHRKVSDIPAREDSALRRNNVGLPGLGFCRDDILLCTHHDARGRLGRLIAGVRDTNKRYGVGIDEETAMTVIEGNGVMAGHCGAFIIEVTHETKYSPAGSDCRFAVENLRLHYITAGDRFDFNSGRILPSAEKAAVGKTSSQAYRSDDIFSRGERKYEATRAILSLVGSPEESVEGRASRDDSYGAGDPVFQVIFRKDRLTKAWSSGEPYSESRSCEHLSGLVKTTVQSLLLDVKSL